MVELTPNCSSMIDTVKLKVRINGDGSPLLLVPGGLTGWQSWEPFVDLFVRKQRKVIRVQLLNVESAIEKSDLPKNYSLKTESHALARSVGSLEIKEPIDIVAWSYGALTSLDFALDNPDRVHTLTLIEPPAIWVLRESGNLDRETMKTLDFFNSLRGTITEDMLASFLQFVGLARQGVSPQELPQWRQWLPFMQSLKNSPAVATHNDRISRLKEFSKPVFLVKGTGSAPFLHKIIDVLAENMPDAAVTEMPEGHAPHLVSRDRFLNELEIFHKEHAKANV